jgi:hypothetical protein
MRRGSREIAGFLRIETIPFGGQPFFLSSLDLRQDATDDLTPTDLQLNGLSVGELE